ncbi:MAG: hypothetical protein AB1414_14770, partial [bacterium]
MTRRIDKPTSISLAIILLLAMVIGVGFFVSQIQANPGDGSGTMEVIPKNVMASSSGNQFDFTYTAAEPIANGELTLSVPASWTEPQDSFSTSPGYVSITATTGNPSVSIFSITGVGPWTISVTLSSMTTNASFTLSYGADSSTKVTAPDVPAGQSEQTYTFTTKTKVTGAGTLTEIASSPQVTVMAYYSSDQGEGSFTAESNPPNTPSNLTQTGNGEYIPWGEKTYNLTPTFSFDLSDPDPSNNQVKYQIQLATGPVTIPANVVVDYTSALGAQGSYSFTVGQAAGSGSYTTGAAYSCTDSDYYWAVQTIDEYGLTSAAWAYANNGNKAFSVDTTPPAYWIDQGEGTFDVRAFNKLILLVPNEYLNPEVKQSPEMTTGKAGTLDEPRAGTSFTVTVLAASDDGYHITNIEGDNVELSIETNGSPDPYAVISPSSVQSMVSGTATFQVTLKIAGKGITRIKANHATKTDDQSRLITVKQSCFDSPKECDYNNYKKLLLLIPGEQNDPGSSIGKKGSVSAQTVGTSFNITVLAVDEYWNLVENAPTTNNSVSITQVGPDYVGTTELPSSQYFTSGVATFTITERKKGDNHRLNAESSNGSIGNSYSSYYTVNPGNPVKLQIIAPGESPNPGYSEGKTGLPITQAAFSSFTFTVNAVDSWWNINTTASAGTVSVSTEDPNDTHPANLNLTNGQAVFTHSFATKNLSPGWNITATHASYTSYTTPKIPVSSGKATQLLVIVPGETFTEGSGKSGTPVERGAGQTFTANIYALDEGFNIDTTNNSEISLSSSAPYDTEPANIVLNNGQGQAEFTFKTANDSPGWTITATDVGGTLAANTSSPVPIVAAGPVKLQVLVPGQKSEPGSDTGKTGFPITQTAGTSFNVTVNIVDNFWNVVKSVSNDVIEFSSTDSLAEFLPATAYLVNGVTTTAVTLKKVGSGTQTITAKDISDPVIANGISAPIPVLPAVLDRFYISNIYPVQTAGEPFNLNLEARDKFENILDRGPNLFERSVNFTISTGPETISPTASSNFTAGKWSGLVEARKKAEVVYITVTDPVTSINSNSNNFEVQKGPFTKLQIILPGQQEAPGTLSGKTGSPDSQYVGQPFNVTVNAVDDCWNLIDTVTDQVYLSSTDSTADLPSLTSLVNGRVTLPATLYDADNSPHTITANDQTNPGKISDESSEVIVRPAPFVRLRVMIPGQYATPKENSPRFLTGPAQTQNAGTPFQIIIDAIDAYGNRVTGATGNVNLEFIDPAPSGTMPTQVALGEGGYGGRAIVLVTINNPGSWQIKAQHENPLKDPDTSSPIPVQIGPLASFTLEVPSSAIAGTPFNLTILAKDKVGNVLSSGPNVFNETVILSSSNGGTISPTSVALSAGVWTGQISLTKTGAAREIKVTYSSVTGQTSININPASADHLSLSPSNLVITTASQGTMEIEVQDKYDNTQPAGSHTVYLTSTASTGQFRTKGTVTQITSVVIPDGQSKAQLDYYDTTVGNPQVSVTSNPLTGDSETVTVVPGNLDHFHFDTISSPQTAGQAFTITITAHDISCNVVTDFT